MNLLLNRKSGRKNPFVIPPAGEIPRFFSYARFVKESP